MFVYGVRCEPADVAALANRGCPVIADYYMDHGILVFPAYTKPTFLAAKSRRQMNPEFWDRLATVAGNKSHEMDILEHPYLSEEEAEALAMIQGEQPSAVTSWYFVPEVVAPAPTLIVSEV
jgi:hypothetical protein